MRCKNRCNFATISMAFISVLIALTIIVTTPTLAEAAERNDSTPKTVNREWQTTADSSLVLIKGLFTGKEHSNETGAPSLSAAERKMLALINQERVEAGLNELEIDYSLVKLARAKSQDMVTHNYFGHISQRLGSIHDQLAQAGIPYRVVAENLAGAGNSYKAQRHLLASPAHRSNILNPGFTRVGIGIVPGGPYGGMITQVFLG